MNLKRGLSTYLGKTYGRLRVIAFDGNRFNGHRYWICECTCGTVKSVSQAALKKRSIVSCGCYNREIISKPKGTLESRFWSFVDRCSPGNCWNWKSGKSKGYGSLRASQERKTLLAHRVSWSIHYGEPPEHLHVLHKCDNPACVNPHHLFLGTDADNVRDMHQKLRHIFGSRNKKAKLTDVLVKNVRTLYSAGMSPSLLKRLYGCNVHSFTHAGGWKHVETGMNYSLPKPHWLFNKTPPKHAQS